MAVTAAAKAAGVAPERVIFNGMLLGGGFGRRGNRDEEFVVDSVLLSKAVKKPVKVLWTREDDVHNGRFRPLYVNYMRAGLDESGHVVAWHHRVACDTVLAYQDPVRYAKSKGKDNIAMRGTELPTYNIPDRLSEAVAGGCRHAHCIAAGDRRRAEQVCDRGLLSTRLPSSAASIRWRSASSC